MAPGQADKDPGLGLYLCQIDGRTLKVTLVPSYFFFVGAVLLLDGTRECTCHTSLGALNTC